jgi:hypothetical protein
MLYLILFLLLTALAVIALAGFVLMLLWRIVANICKKTNLKQLVLLKRTALFFAAVTVLNIGLIAVSQLTAATPRITDENGKTPPNRIDKVGAERQKAVDQPAGMG